MKIERSIKAKLPCKFKLISFLPQVNKSLEKIFIILDFFIAVLCLDFSDFYDWIVLVAGRGQEFGNFEDWGFLSLLIPMFLPQVKATKLDHLFGKPYHNFPISPTKLFDRIFLALHLFVLKWNFYLILYFLRGFSLKHHQSNRFQIQNGARCR